MNDNGVTSAEHARNYLDSARATADHLTSLYGGRDKPMSQHRAEVAEANAALGFALKAAHVCATLAIAEAIRDLADADALVEVAERWGRVSCGVPPVSAGVQA